MLRIAKQRLLLNVEKSIANIKIGLGIWCKLDSNHFKKKKREKEEKMIEEKRARFAELLLEAKRRSGEAVDDDGNSQNRS